MKNYSKGALQSANKKMTVIIALMLAIIIAVSVILGVGFGVYGTDASKWFKSQSADDNAPQEPQVDNNFVASVQSTNGISLLSAPATIAEDGETTVVRVTATVLPEAAPQEVDWTIAFANPSSEWATGKTVTDYVTVTPTADGAKTADVAVVKAFGEQIVVTVTSRDDNSKTATVTADYVKRYSFKNWKYANNEYGFGAELSVSDGTIDEDINYSIKLSASETFWQEYTEAMSKTGIDFSSSFSYETAKQLNPGQVVVKIDSTRVSIAEKITGRGTNVLILPYKNSNNKAFVEIETYAFFNINNGDCESLTYSERNKVAQALNPIFLKYRNDSVTPRAFKVTFTLSGEHSNISESLDVGLLVATPLPTYVDSVSVDVPSIIF